MTTYPATPRAVAVDMPALQAEGEHPMRTHHRPHHPARELAGSLADAADDLAGWATGRRPERNGINGLIGWFTGSRRKGNSLEQLASWITGRKPR